MLIGSDMRELKSSITRSLCDQIFTSPTHRSKATNFSETATHAIDFGLGGLSSIGSLTVRNLDVVVSVLLFITGDKGKEDAELFNIKYESCWSKKWAPGLVRVISHCFFLSILLFNIAFISDGEIYLDTLYSQLLGKPPIMVAGITPSTVKAGFVSAVLDAGYHIELAGGGY